MMNNQQRSRVRHTNIIIAITAFAAALCLYTLRSVKWNIPEVLLYNLPDGLWAFSLATGIFSVWGRLSVFAVIWVIILWLLSSTLELLQRFDWMPGTFDRYDLLAYSLGIAASLFLQLFNIKPYEEP